MPLICPKCGTAAPDNARFCELDGTRLGSEVASAVVPARSANPTTAPGCGKCGAGADAQADGYCNNCGSKWTPARAALPRDHVPIALSGDLGGVTDRGMRHGRNEDDLALSVTAAGDFVLVVCDGVSSSEEADRASAIAAKTLCDRLSLPTDDPDTALREAVAAANSAVSALSVATPGATTAPPETTCVAAYVSTRVAHIAWVGDSRAYWIDFTDTTAARILTHDHSWMNDMTDTGQMTADEAGRNRLAHAITRCLGASDDPESSEPTLATFPLPDTGGYLLLCSDGLWNYADSPAQIAALVQDAPQDGGMVAIAAALTAWANTQGGRDNITVALLRVAPVVPVVSTVAPVTLTEIAG